MTTQVAVLEAKNVNGVLVLGFPESKILDEAKIQSIGKELTASLAKVKNGRIVLDFDGVEFMSSAMIGKLVLMHRKCKASSVQLQVARLSDNIMQVFKVTRLDKLFTFYPDDDAESLLAG